MGATASATTLTVRERVTVLNWLLTVSVITAPSSASVKGWVKFVNEFASMGWPFFSQT